MIRRTPTAYYNEFDPYAAQWLRNLIDAGHIAPGDVDERSIEDVTPDDVRGYRQAHFFAGIGLWSLALRMTGWPDDRPVWTGSCPCQPFSKAGKQLGDMDGRHLWPVWKALLAECKPPACYGEQTSTPLGRTWLDGLFDDMEQLGYAVAGADLPAASVGAPHIRQRLWWVAYSNGAGLEGRWRPVQRARERIARAGLQEPDWRGPSPADERLVDGRPCRVGRIRAYGNAIVPQVAAAFIRAAEEARVSA